jgi:hypothetical protein
MALLKVVHPLKIYQNTEFHGPTFSGGSLHSPQKSERPPFAMLAATALKLWCLGLLQ